MLVNHLRQLFVGFFTSLFLRRCEVALQFSTNVKEVLDERLTEARRFFLERDRGCLSRVTLLIRLKEGIAADFLTEVHDAASRAHTRQNLKHVPIRHICCVSCFDRAKLKIFLF